MARTERAMPELNGDLTTFMEFNHRNFEVCSKSCETMMQAVADMNTGTCRFAVRRLERDMEMPARVAQCQSPADLARLQFEFFGELISDYTEETQRVLSLASDFAKNSAEAANGS